MNKDPVKDQFDARSSQFSRSASWVTDRGLLAAHRRASRGLLPAKGRMLEVCCGTGEVTGALKRPGLETHGLDISPGMLKKAAARIRHPRLGDAHELPYPDSFFDAVVMRQAMQFLRPDVFLKEARRVLRPGGALLLSHHVPETAVEKRCLLGIYRLIQPGGIFKDPSKLYMASDLAAAVRAAGLKIAARLPVRTTESIDALLKCYPNLSSGQKAGILGAYSSAPAAQRRACRVSLGKRGVSVAWGWIVIAAVKPKRKGGN